jgi:hypothetical protein
VKRLVFASILSLALVVGVAVSAQADLNAFLNNVNIEARADRDVFAARLSTHFEVPGVQVKAVLGSVKEPADAFMLFELGRMTGKPVTEVKKVYQANRGKGWGVIAKNLGIKPGSPEFHALKRGDFDFEGGPGKGGKGKGKDKGKDKHQGRGKGKNKD